MQIQTFSIVVGTMACDAKCPFCVSRMTGKMDTAPAREVNWRNFDIACNLAMKAGGTTAMLTGKGEPTLWPDLITDYLEHLKNKFPIIELQTNGLRLATMLRNLLEWYKMGLTTVAISVAHWERIVNAKIYLGDTNKTYPDLAATIDMLHKIGFSVRLCCIGIKDLVDSAEGILTMAEIARGLGVEQLTWTPVNMPQSSEDPIAKAWTQERMISEEKKAWIVKIFDHKFQRIMELSHGAIVYDIDGQNVCVSNCLNTDAVDLGNIRNLIFFPDGHLRYRWDKKGAIIL